MSKEEHYCSDCGTGLVAETASNNEPDWYCPKCDDNIWKKCNRSYSVRLFRKYNTSKNIRGILNAEIIVGGKITEPMNLYINIPLHHVHYFLERDIDEIKLKSKHQIL